MNYVSQRDVLAQFGISLSTLKRWKKNRGFPNHLSLSKAVLVLLEKYSLAVGSTFQISCQMDIIIFTIMEKTEAIHVSFKKI